jgi:hypothetical protein
VVAPQALPSNQPRPRVSLGCRTRPARFELAASRSGGVGGRGRTSAFYRLNTGDSPSRRCGHEWANSAVLGAIPGLWAYVHSDGATSHYRQRQQVPRPSFTASRSPAVGAAGAIWLGRACACEALGGPTSVSGNRVLSAPTTQRWRPSPGPLPARAGSPLEYPYCARWEGALAQDMIRLKLG